MKTKTKKHLKPDGSEPISDHMLTVRVPDKTMKLLNKESKKRAVSRSDFVRYAIEKQLPTA
jgi:metal-responsive CopG/Arc/MetJ family transcriptional regulator